MSPRKAIVIDLDNTLCVAQDGDYANARPVTPVIDQVRKMRELGYAIVIHTSRNMRTFESNIGLITRHTVPIIAEWLERHDVPYDELHVGKPWCGNEGFYVDDRAIRPSEFARMTESEIKEVINRETQGDMQ